MKGIYPIPKWITDYYKDIMLRERTKCFKTCSKCGETKLIFKFSADRRNIGGRTNICKACRSLEGLKYYYHNRGKRLIQNKEYRETHKRDRSIYLKNYQEEHKEHLKERAREWYIKNREKIKERNKKYYRDHEQACLVRRRIWRIKNREKIREYGRKYRLLKKKS